MVVDWRSRTAKNKATGTYFSFFFLFCGGLKDKYYSTGNLSRGQKFCIKITRASRVALLLVPNQPYLSSSLGFLALQGDEYDAYCFDSALGLAIS